MSELSTQGNEIENLVKLDFFSEIGKAMASANTLAETFDCVMEQIGRAFAPEHWSVLLLDRKSGDLVFHVVVGSASDGLLGRKLPKGRGIAGWIVENAKPAIVSDVSQDARFDPEMDKVASFTTKSIIGVPLAHRDQVYGVIELINKVNGRSFTPFELRLLTTIADYAAIAIERAYYFRMLRRLALRDPLTNLYNRRVLNRNLERESERVRRYGTTFALLMIDVDGFKQINDTHGHVAGDEVLKSVARVLKSVVRKVDIVARFGGDEFVVLMPDASDNAARRVVDRIQEMVGARNEEASVSYSVSIGSFQASSDNIDNVLSHVDSEMYSAKNAEEERTYGDLPAHLRDVLEDFE